MHTLCSCSAARSVAGIPFHFVPKCAVSVVTTVPKDVEWYLPGTQWGCTGTLDTVGYDGTQWDCIGSLDMVGYDGTQWDCIGSLDMVGYDGT